MRDIPFEGAQIDRWPDKDGPYRKDNCRWATARENMLNREWRGNLSGCQGVTYNRTRDRYIACTVKVYGKKTALYTGPDFFEAVCARKSWELRA